VDLPVPRGPNRKTDPTGVGSNLGYMGSNFTRKMCTSGTNVALNPSGGFGAAGVGGRPSRILPQPADPVDGAAGAPPPSNNSSSKGPSLLFPEAGTPPFNTCGFQERLRARTPGGAGTSSTAAGFPTATWRWNPAIRTGSRIAATPCRPTRPGACGVSNRRDGPAAITSATRSPAGEPRRARPVSGHAVRLNRNA